MLITTFCPRDTHARTDSLTFTNTFVGGLPGASATSGGQKGQREPASLHKDWVSPFVSLEDPVTGTAWAPGDQSGKKAFTGVQSVCVRVSCVSSLVVPQGEIRMSQMFATVKC